MSTVSPFLPFLTLKKQACQPLGNNVYVTSDHDAETSYVSSQFPCQPETEALVRQACTRSLSCEVLSVSLYFVLLKILSA